MATGTGWAIVVSSSFLQRFSTFSVTLISLEYDKKCDDLHLPPFMFPFMDMPKGGGTKNSERLSLKYPDLGGDFCQQCEYLERSKLLQSLAEIMTIIAKVCACKKFINPWVHARTIFASPCTVVCKPKGWLSQAHFANAIKSERGMCRKASGSRRSLSPSMSSSWPSSGSTSWLNLLFS